jgi:hypothetical protein
MSPEQIDLINSFLSGVIVMGHATAGLFFLRFWRRTSDRLFLLFAIAFWLLGLVRILMLILNHSDEDHVLFWFRFVAYLIILAAIIDKNVRK